MKHELIVPRMSSPPSSVPRVVAGGHPWTLTAVSTWGENLNSAEGPLGPWQQTPDWLSSEEVVAGLLQWHREIQKGPNANSLRSAVEVVFLRRQGKHLLYAMVGRAKIFARGPNSWQAVDITLGWEDATESSREPLPKYALGLPFVPQIRWGYLPWQDVQQILVWNGKSPSQSIHSQPVLKREGLQKLWTQDVGANDGWCLSVQPESFGS